MVKRTTEEKQNVTEDDIRMKLRNLSPLLQQEYLENLLKRIEIQSNIKVFASRALAELYVAKRLYSSAAKIMENAADAALSFNDKKNILMTTAILYIKSGDYLMADDAFRRAVEIASPGEKGKLQLEAKNLMYTEAQDLAKENKFSKSVKIYERLLRSAATVEEKKKYMMPLVPLYEKLSRISDSIAMRNSLKTM